MNEQEIKVEVSAIHQIMLAKGYKWPSASAVISGGFQGVSVFAYGPDISESILRPTMREAIDATAEYVNSLPIMTRDAREWAEYGSRGEVA